MTRAIKLKPEQAKEVAYYIAAMADSTDHNERRRLAQQLANELGLTPEQMADATETRQGVREIRSRRIVREYQRRRQMAVTA